jgi:hypothetical protein
MTPVSVMTSSPRSLPPSDSSESLSSQVNTFIHSTVEGRTSKCDACHLQLVVLVSIFSLYLFLSAAQELDQLVAPCGHLYCPDCMQDMVLTFRPLPSHATPGRSLSPL